MTNSYLWSVTAIDCLPTAPGTALTDCVYITHWNCVATSSQINPSTNLPYTSSMYGTVMITYDPNDPYIPYNQLTEAEVLAWVFEVMDQEPETSKASKEAALAAVINNEINPPVVPTPLPWGTS